MSASASYFSIVHSSSSFVFNFGGVPRPGPNNVNSEAPSEETGIGFPCFVALEVNDPCVSDSLSDEVEARSKWTVGWALRGFRFLGLEGICPIVDGKLSSSKLLDTGW